MDESSHSVSEDLDTYSEAVDRLVETTGEHSRSVEGLDSAMATLRESVAEMNDAVDDYGDAVDAFDDAVASLQRTAAGGAEPRASGRTTEPPARPSPGYPAAGD